MLLLMRINCMRTFVLALYIAGYSSPTMPDLKSTEPTDCALSDVNAIVGSGDNEFGVLLTLTDSR